MAGGCDPTHGCCVVVGVSRFNKDQRNWIALPGLVSGIAFVFMFALSITQVHFLVSIFSALFFSIVVCMVLSVIDVMATWTTYGRLPNYFESNE